MLLGLRAGMVVLLLLTQHSARLRAPVELSFRRQWLALFGPVRPVEGRLVGCAYATLSGPVVALPASPIEAQHLVRHLHRQADRQPAAGTLADLSLVELVAGRSHAAVSLLQQAVARNPADAALVSDLAAAHLALATADPRHLVSAFSLAERALRLAPSMPEARFNGALALEKLHLRREAGAAWQAYLRLDPSSPWAAEVRQRLARLGAASRGGSFKDEMSRVREEVIAGDEASVARLVSDFPQECRLDAQDRLLPAWAMSLAGGDVAEARRQLAVARAIGEALRRGPGATLVADSLAAIDRAMGAPRRLRAMIAGELAYGAGLVSDAGGNYRAAETAFAHARNALRAARSPAAAWADLDLALCDYHLQDYRRAGARLDALAARSDSRDPGLRGRILWIHGLVEIAQGNLGASLRDYLGALDAFSALRESEHIGLVNVLIAENLRFLGDPARAWTHRLAALALEEPVMSSRLQAALQEAAASCLNEDAPEMAARFQAEAIQTALELQNPHQVAEAYLRRIPIDVKMGERATLETDLAAVKRFSAAIPDLRLRQRLWADAISAASQMLLASEPSRAVRDLTTALDFYGSRSFSLTRAELLLDRARGHLQLGEPALAAVDAAASLGELESQAARTGDPILRLKVHAQGLPILRELTLLEWRLRRDPWTALTYTERAHIDAPPKTLRNRLEVMARHLPGNVALIELAALPDRLLSFSVTREGLSWNDRPVAAARFAELLDRLASARESKQLDAVRACLSELYDLLVRPLHAACDKSLLVFIPDDTLMGVPFGALIRRESGRYLLQERAVMVAPAALALRHQPTQVIPPARRTLVVGDPAFDRDLFPDLGALPASRAEAKLIGALYPASTVLIDREATQRSVLAAIKNADIIHLGAHALDVADASLLLLAPEKRPAQPRDSGTLSAGDVLRSRVRASSLVVLASCGRGRQMGGRWSLGRAFLAAGATSVVESLWPVDDRDTADLFVDFHRLVRSNVAPVQALREAQLYQLRSKGPQGPLDWAAFQVVSTSIPKASTEDKKWQ